MPDLRQNPVTGRWVVMAPGRSDRPLEAGPGSGGAEGGQDAGRVARDEGCPFCPGNEAELPEILWELQADGESGWRCRAVPNRYPAFTDVRSRSPSEPHPEALREDVDGPVTPGRSRPAVGRQEVLIESPHHDRHPGVMDPDELEAVVELYRHRVTATNRAGPELAPSLFRNHGAAAGASLRHPHAQLVAPRVRGPARRIREERLRRYHSESGDCLLCSLPEVEPEGRRRVVEEDDHHRAYVPWAPERRLEVWLLPKRHRASFAAIDAAELRSLAAILGRTLRRIRSLVPDPDYNYVIHTSSAGSSEDPALHWFVQIRPVTSHRAGFEVDTGVVIAPASPGSSADRLRRVKSGRMDLTG